MEPGVTVVICTYNGALLMPETIRHIAQQSVQPEIPWEIIIIDNASTDNTAEVVLTEWGKYGSMVQFKLLHQPEKGLSNARKMALANARYEFVLFCDDDNWLNPDYVTLGYQLMLQNPSIGVLGGNGELVFEKTPPEWAIGTRIFAHGAQAAASGKVYNNVLYGAGCIIRKAAYNTLESAGFKSLLTDRNGASLASGGDYELCYAIALAGYNIWYDEALKFRHYIPEKRNSWDYNTRFFKDNALSYQVLIPYNIIVNQKSKSPLLFRLRYFKILLVIIKRLLILYLIKPILSPESVSGKINRLERISQKSKLQGFSDYSIIFNNFNAILELREHLIK